jgi:hypothetical protein
MNDRRRQQIMSILAIVAVIAVSAKFIKAIWRGEITQSRVKPLN